MLRLKLLATSKFAGSLCPVVELKMNRLSFVLFSLSCCWAGWLVAEDGYREIFNGKDLIGWAGNSDLWSVEDGCITGRTTAEKPIKFNTFLVWEGGTVNDFEIEFDYKLGSEGNSGVQYRSKLLKASDFVVGGYQADIDATLKYAGINYEEKGRGILALRGQRTSIDKTGAKQSENFGDATELGKKIKAGDWNHYHIVANGTKLTHSINDAVMSEVIDDQEGKSAAEGILAFQLHVGPPMKIQFKNIRLKP
jgi:hypothetical protein